MAERPVGFNALQRSLNSPWRGIGEGLSAVTNVYLPEPNISLPKISESVYARFLRDSKTRTSARASFDDVLYKSATPTSRLYEKGLISEPSYAGVLTRGNVRNEQWSRLTHDNQDSLGDLLSAQDDIMREGAEPITQPDGLWNRITDVMMRLEYAAATNQHDNSRKEADVIEMMQLGRSMIVDPMKQFLMGNQSQEQVSYDADHAKRADMEAELADIYAREGESTSYVSLKQVYDNWMASKVRDYGSPYHPMANPTGEQTFSGPTQSVIPGGSSWEAPDKWREWNAKRPEGEYESVYEGERLNALKKRAEKGKDVFDIVPPAIPISGEEWDSWKEGITGRSKRTFTQNNIEDKGYSAGEAAFLGLFQSVGYDFTTYLTGGFGTVGKGAKLAELGGVSKDLIRLKTGDQALDLFKNLDVTLAGEKLSVGGKVFEFGKNNLKGFEDIITGGPRSGRQLSKSRIVSQQKAIVTEINAKLSKAVNTKYIDLGNELKGLSKAVKKAQDPIVIEKSFVTLANKAASLNLDKAVADTIETLIRQGDEFKNVPLPTPRSSPVDWLDDASELSDEAVQASTTATTASRMARLGYTTKQAAMHAEAAASKITKGTRKLAKGTPRPPVAKKVMTYTSYSGMKGKQVVAETLRLAKANDPNILRIFENYAEYLKAHGASKIITAEDLATSVALQGNKLVAPEVKAMMELFDIGKVDLNSSLGRMFKAMGYSDEQAFRALSKYKSELADGFVKNGDNFYGAQTRLVDADLDWAPVKLARDTNVKVINEASALVKKQSGIVADNIAKAMAETSIRLAQEAGIKNSLELRVLGIPVVHLQTPASVNKMMNTFMAGDTLIAKSFNRAKARNTQWFRGYSQLDAELNLARTRTIGQGEQIIHSLIGYAHKTWGRVPGRVHNQITDHWIAGANPQVLEDYGAQLSTLDETFNAIQSYAAGITRVDSVGDVKLGDLVDRLNPYLSNTFKLDKEVLKKTAKQSKAEFLGSDWWREYYVKKWSTGQRGASYSSPNISGLDLMWSMRIASEKAIAKSNLVDNIESMWGLHKGAAQVDPAAWKVLNSGEDAWRPVSVANAGFDDTVLFPPDLRSEITKLFSLVDGRSAEEMGLGAISNASTMWKALVTVYNVPAYTVRNAVSDYIMMGFAGVTPTALGRGPKIMAETKLYRDLLRKDPEFARAFTMADVNNPASMKMSLELADKAYDAASTTPIIRFGRGFVGEGGQRVNGLTSTEVLKRYYEYGLETNFVRTSLNAVNPKLRRTSRYVGENLKQVNSFAEDTRRLGLFTDGLRLAEKRGIRNMDEALEFAAERTRKYLFDYSDFSNIERNVLGRIIPFYKWTRKAVPLMAEMLFLKPGKANLINKMQQAVSTSQGQEPDGLNMPNIPTVDAIVSSYMRLNPYMYLGSESVDGGENGVYGSISNPMAQVFSGIIDPLVWGDSTADPNASLWEQSTAYAAGALKVPVQMSSPEIRMPFELATGTQAFGANELGGRPIDNVAEYLMAMFPQAKLTNDLVTNGVPNSPLEIADTLGAMNVQHNTPNKQASELFFLQQMADNRRRKLEASKDERLGIVRTDP